MCLSRGLPRGMEQPKIDEFSDLAAWLEKRYPRQYPRGIVYLRQLAGEVVMHQEPLPRLQFLNPQNVQARGVPRINLPDPLENDVHSLRVQFHRV